MVSILSDNRFEIEKVGHNAAENVINKIRANWNTVLILIGTISSLFSLGWSQTSIYFASQRKRKQKTLKNKALVALSLMMQVMPKVLACQAFTFGLIGSNLNKPDAILWVLFFFPLVSSFWKVFTLWYFFRFLDFKSDWLKFFLSPFILPRSSDDNYKQGEFKIFIILSGRLTAVFHPQIHLIPSSMKTKFPQWGNIMCSLTFCR